MCWRGPHERAADHAVEWRAGRDRGDARLHSAAVGIHLDAGSRHEGPHENGLAHLVEHMVFKGAGARSARQIAENIEDVGGQLNAYTGRDATVFHARVLGGDVPLAFGMLADMLLLPRFDAGDLAQEVGVVLSELGEARDTPDDIVFDHLQAAAFPDSPLGRSILGDEASLAAFTVTDLRGWLGRALTGPGLVVAAAGAVDHDALVEMAHARLGALPATPRLPADAAAFAPGVHHDRRRFEQAHLALGWPGPAQLDPGFAAANLFVTIAGGGASSRLFQELREERGLAYSVSAGLTGYAETGLMTAYIAADLKQSAAALALLETTLHDAAATLTPAELARAQAQVRAGLLMALESPEQVMSALARGLQLEGRVVPLAELAARYDGVTLEQARAAGAALLAGAPARAGVGAARLKLAA